MAERGERGNCFGRAGGAGEGHADFCQTTRAGRGSSARDCSSLLIRYDVIVSILLSFTSCRKADNDGRARGKMLQIRNTDVSETYGSRGGLFSYLTHSSATDLNNRYAKPTTSSPNKIVSTT